MKQLFGLLVLGIVLPSFSFADEYSNRVQALRDQQYQERQQAEVASTQADNNLMEMAMQAYANYKHAALGERKCPIRAEVLWGVSMGNDPWGHLRYQYCHFTAGDDACSIGMTFGAPVYISCIKGNEQRSYMVSAHGAVSPYGRSKSRRVY